VQIAFDGEPHRPANGFNFFDAEVSQLTIMTDDEAKESAFGRIKLGDGTF
jgi:hypothetical protein